MFRLLLLVPLFAAACSTDYKVAQATKSCSAYGYTAGPEMTDCIAAEIQNRRAAAAAYLAMQ